MLHRDRVATHPERTRDVLARFVGGGFEVDASLHVTYRDLGVRHDRTGLVLYRSNDAARILLRPQRYRGGDANHGEKKNWKSETGQVRHGNPPRNSLHWRSAENCRLARLPELLLLNCYERLLLLSFCASCQDK